MRVPSELRKRPPDALRRRVIICADDFGIAPGVDRAIAELTKQGRITAASCMTVASSWPADASLLRPLEEAVDLGLHFTLTDQRPLGAMPKTAPQGLLPSLSSLVGAAMLRRLDTTEIRDEFRRQLSAFERGVGRPPDFVDGHRHIHLLPVIRSVVIEELIRCPGMSVPYLRICHTPLATLLARRVAMVRAFFISWFSDRLRAMAARNGVPVISSFSGIYNFSDRRPYRDLLKRFLIGLGDNGLLMCHPGFVDAELCAVDDLTKRREDEFAYFSGPDCPRDFAEAGVVPTRFLRRASRS